MRVSKSIFSSDSNRRESIDLVYVKVKCSGVLVLKMNEPFCCDEIKFEKKNCNNFMK